MGNKNIKERIYDLSGTTNEKHSYTYGKTTSKIVQSLPKPVPGKTADEKIKNIAEFATDYVENSGNEGAIAHGPQIVKQVVVDKLENDKRFQDDIIDTAICESFLFAEIFDSLREDC